MKFLWSAIDSSDMSIRSKFYLLILLLAAGSAAAGSVFWLCLRSFACSSLDYLFLFTAYPAAGSLLFVLFYSFNYDFHKGSFPQHSQHFI